MWPFDIFAKRRAAREAKERAEHAERMDRVKASIEAAKKHTRAAQAAIDRAQSIRAAAPRKASLSVVPHPINIYADPLNPINPLSPLNPINQVSIWPAVSEEPRHASSHCDGTAHTHDYGGSWSFSDHGSSHSHDHGCSSGSFDSGSSSSGSDF
jgi:hypothetical protein